jgi:hypothetical protein
MWFFYRMIQVAFLDARAAAVEEPSDDAILARDWIACSVAAPPKVKCDFVSFPQCCAVLGLDPDVERIALLDMIDKAIDLDTDATWARLAELSAREPLDDLEPLFDAPRIVPALDQIALF